MAIGGSGTSGQAPCIKIMIMNYVDFGLCCATNEHPRRAVDVIFSQSEALIDIFNSR